MSGWQGNEVGQVFCDLNGEEYRAHEWMLALCRLLEVGEITHPADCLGDVGAAFAPVLIGLAALALARDHEVGRALVACSSDFGARGSVCLQASQA